MKAARVITLSDAERLATVDKGWGLLTRGEKIVQYVKFKTRSLCVKACENYKHLL